MSGAAKSTNHNDRTVFRGDLSAPEPVPMDGVTAAVQVMKDGRLHRYGEDRGTIPEAALLEEEFAELMNRRFCVGLNSGGCALFVGLKAAGLEPGEPVLVNAFTLAPVPGAIQHAGGTPVLVDITDRLVIDIDDLNRKAEQSGAKYLLLSYMRGHIPDMDALMAVCERHGLIIIEDCAHTMGAGWNGKLTGGFGAAGCFSTQTFKHINSGEGGLLVTDDPDLAARAILLTGSYMLYRQHRARPDDEVFERHRLDVPNCSMRMSNLVGAILRPQLSLLYQRNDAWRRIYRSLEEGIAQIPNLSMPTRPVGEEFVPSSLQFFVSGLSHSCIRSFLSHASECGVHVKWFGEEEPIGFTSRHDHWRYITKRNNSAVPNADRLLRSLCDIRLPPWLSQDDCDVITSVLSEAMESAMA